MHVLVTVQYEDSETRALQARKKKKNNSIQGEREGLTSKKKSTS